jgi:hypothetical protein
MINLKVDEAARVLTVEMQGRISEADIDSALDRLQEAYPAVGVHLHGGEKGGFCMLMDWERLEGWELGAKTIGTMAAKMIADAIRKVAVIADARWSDEEPRLADVAKGAKVSFFLPDRRDAALHWLLGK